MRPERVSKLAIAAWACVALFIEFYYASPGWANLTLVGPILFVAALLASLIDKRSVVLVAAAPYLFPALLYGATGDYHVHHTAAWLGAMLGMVLPDACTRPWHTPRRWSLALACWAGVICVTAPIVVLRIVDFRLELLTRSRLPHEALGGYTYQGIGWVGHVSLLLVIGILWFDWLLSLEERFFARWIAAPLAGGALVLALLSVYQMLGDISFLNPTVYASIGRATGTMLDANVAGAASALWVGGFLLIGQRARGRTWLLVAAGVSLAWLSVWASGSRTAFACAVIVSIFALVALIRTRAIRPRTLLAAAVLVVALCAAAFAIVSRTHVHAVGPLARFRMMTATEPGVVPSTLKDIVFQTLWIRDGYGLAANRMIAKYPAFGVGVGAFHNIAPEFAGWLPADNAQNWFRHQIAEIGLVGALGAIVFVLSFGWWVVRPHRHEPASAWIPRGMLIGIALISLVGMPGQDPAIAITIWTVAAWYLLVAGRPEPAPQAPLAAWLAVMIVILVAGVGTAQLAAGRLRVPVRIQHALRGDYAEYSYGLWPTETDAEGEFRWARPQATAVVPAAGRVLVLTTGVNFDDLAEHPTHAKAWVDGRLVIDRQLTADTPVVETSVLLPEGEHRVLIETWADRAVTAPPPDGRELALMVRWRFAPGAH